MNLWVEYLILDYIVDRGNNDLVLELNLILELDIYFIGWSVLLGLNLIGFILVSS